MEKVTNNQNQNQLKNRYFSGSGFKSSRFKVKRQGNSRHGGQVKD